MTKKASELLADMHEWSRGQFVLRDAQTLRYILPNLVTAIRLAERDHYFPIEEHGKAPCESCDALAELAAALEERAR